MTTYAHTADNGRHSLLFWLLIFAFILICSGTTAVALAEDNPAKKPADTKAKPADKAGWISLFDGKTLTGWEVTKFGGEGEVSVKDGQLILGVGVDLTGVRTNRKLPKINYEVELEAQRVNGSDFFCGLTFPVKDDPCSLIVGGWGGGVCGLSSIDELDASENETTTYQEFKPKQWYRIRLKVTDKKIEAWIDDKQVVNQETEGRKIGIRREVELSKPFGFASWQTTAALRNVRLRPLGEKPKS